MKKRVTYISSGKNFSVNKFLIQKNFSKKQNLRKKKFPVEFRVNYAIRVIYAMQLPPLTIGIKNHVSVLCHPAKR